MVDFSEVKPGGIVHLVLFGLWLPYLAIKTASRLKSRPYPPKKKYLVSVIVQLAALGLFSYLIARDNWIPIFPRQLPAPKYWALGAATLVALVTFMRPMWRKAVAKRGRRTWLVMPRDRKERLLWAGCSLGAGISEEITYRGVMFTLLWRITGSAVVAALVMAAVFGVSHFLQGWTSMAIIVGIALAMQGLAWLSGSLYVSMAVHAVYDLIAGLSYGKLGEELGYPIEAPPPETGTATGTATALGAA
jgi:membrane protease YdiL (CAAX protease family)